MPRRGPSRKTRRARSKTAGTHGSCGRVTCPPISLIYPPSGVPLPVQRPQPPVTVGGNGLRLLTLAAKEADIVNLTGITFTRGGTLPDMSGWRAPGIEERMRVVREAAGQRFGSLVLSAQVQRVIVTDRRREVAEELRKSWKELSVEEILEAPYALIGTVDEMVEALHARRERWGLSYFVTFEPYLETLAPIVARLTGK